MLDMPKKMDEERKASESTEGPYDSNKNFIFIVDPFIQYFTRVLYTFNDEDDSDNIQSEPVLFVNAAVLVVGVTNNLHYCVLEKAGSDSNGGSTRSSMRDSQVVQKMLK